MGLLGGMVELFNQSKEKKPINRETKQEKKQRQEEDWNNYLYGDGVHPKNGRDNFSNLGSISKLEEKDMTKEDELLRNIEYYRNIPLSKIVIVERDDRYDGFEYRTYLRFNKLCYGIVMEHLQNNLQCDSDAESQVIKREIIENLKFLKKQHPYLEECIINRKNNRGYYMMLKGREVNYLKGNKTDWEDFGPMTMM